jgi:transcriptional regulator with XRE-family HTH domain
MDISVKHCSAVERGKSSLSIEKLVKLCDTFDVSMDYLIRGIDHYRNLEKINPGIILEIEKYDDKKSQTLLLEYLHMFKKISEKNG